MRSECLYVHGETCIGADDFTKALRAVGTEDNDVLFVHSDIRAFGKLGPEANRDDLCRYLIEGIEKSVPNGTVVMPSFTYSFGKGTPFDLQNSPSEVGTLSEFFRKEQAEIRSRHPIFSVAAKGREAKKLTDVDMDSVGDHSFFAHLLARNGLIIAFGSPFIHSATFMHYVEQKHGVPYRYVKKFHGTFRDGGKEEDVTCTYFVRRLELDADVDTDRLEKRNLRERFL